MQQWKKNLIVLWVGAFITAASFSLISPFLPVFLAQMDVGDNLEFWSGLLFSASFFASCLLSPVWGALADKYGRKAMVIRAGVGLGLVNLLTSTAKTPLHLLFLRTLNGMASGFIPGSTALVATNTPEDKIGTSLGLLQTGAASGHVLGPLLGGIMSHYLGIRQTFVVAGITMWVATAIVIFGVKEITKPLGKNYKLNVIGDFKAAWADRNFRTLMFFVTFINATVMIVQPVLTPFIMTMIEGDPSVTTGIVFSLTGIATIIAAPLWSKRGTRIGFRNTLSLCILLSGLINIPQSLARSVVYFGALRFSYGLAYAGAQISIQGLTAQAVKPEFRGRAFGINRSFMQLGSVVGPMLGGFIGSTLGIPWVFLVNGTLLITLGMVTKKLLPEPTEKTIRQFPLKS